MIGYFYKYRNTKCYSYISQALGDHKESEEVTVNTESVHGITVQLLVPDTGHPQEVQQLLLWQLGIHHGPGRAGQSELVMPQVFGCNLVFCMLVITLICY